MNAHHGTSDPEEPTCLVALEHAFLCGRELVITVEYLTLTMLCSRSRTSSVTRNGQVSSRFRTSDESIALLDAPAQTNVPSRLSVLRYNGVSLLK